jgi:hypothetical protein
MSKEKYIKAQVTVECFFKTDKLQNIEEIKSYVQSVLNNHLNEEWQTMRTMPNWNSFKITEYKEMYAKGYGANWDKLTKDEKESAIEYEKKEAIRSKSFAKGGGVDDLEYKRRIKKFGYKPYGKIKGRFTVYFIYEGKEQKEITETKEMAIDTAKRYSKLFNSVKVKDENGNEIEYSKGGKTTFKDKVASIKAKLLKNKKVPKAVQKDYGKTFSPAEAEDSAKRIAGAMRKKELINKK